ncbi:MAG: hypothetical protein II569_01150, partial [Paludibacteraceae bacterium]|nr:hypothetical protein [Paludibacteraceae bacterium]
MKLDYYDFQALLLNHIFIAGESLKNSKEVLGHLDSKTVTPTGIQMLGSKNARDSRTSSTWTRTASS